MIQHIGSVYHYLSQDKIALKYQLESLLMIRSIFKGNNKDFSEVINDSANSYLQLHDMNKAFYKQNQSFEMNKFLFNEMHHYITINYYNFGNYYIQIGDLTNTLKYFQKSLQISQQLFGNYHSQVAGNFYQIGFIYDQIGYLEKALEKYLQSLEIFKQIYIQNRIQVFRCMLQISLIYKKLNETAKAEELLLQGRDEILNYCISNQYDPKYFEVLGDFQYYLCKFEDSLKAYNKSLRMSQQMFQNESINSSIIRLIGRSFIKYGLFKKGKVYLLQALEIAKRSFKNNNLEIIQYLIEIGELYTKYREKNTKSFMLFLFLKYIVKCYSLKNDFDQAYKISIQNFQQSAKCKINEQYQEGSLKLIAKSCQDIQNYKCYLLCRLQYQDIKEEDNLLRIRALYEILGDMYLAIEYYQEIFERIDYIVYRDGYITESDSHSSESDAFLIFLLNLGSCYKQIQQYEEALKYFFLLHDLIKDSSVVKEVIQDLLQDIIFCLKKCSLFKISNFYQKQLNKLDQNQKYWDKKLNLIDCNQYF